MSSYTMTLKECLETLLMFDDVNAEELSTKQLIEEGRKKLFDFDYQIFDPLYKGVFETNFIRNFYMREIGFETEGLFKFQLETWLLINMPFFNKMFESELIEFDPLVNSKMTADYTKKKDTDGTVDINTDSTNTNVNNQSTIGTQTTDNFNRDIESDTPDSRLAITTADGSGVIEYASKITENKNKGTNTNDISTNGGSTDTIDLTGQTVSDVTELETFLQTREGKTGSVTYSKMLSEYRKTFLRIEKEIFSEMQQLFMLVY